MNSTASIDEPLDVAAIAAALNAFGDLARRFDVDVLGECDSTNTRLMALAEGGAASGSVLIAGRQTAGRGRRGRSWTSAPGDSLTFSLLWRFPAGTSLAGLSLAVGVALARALEALGLTGLTLKWPNDLLLQERKLAGILIELVPSPRPQAAVIGIGLNLRLPRNLPEELKTTTAALSQAADPPPAASQVLAHLLVSLHEQLADFTRHGFAGVRAAWQARHAHQDRPVRLLSDFAPPLDGCCRGADEDGALLLETDTGLQRILSGEVSLRAAAT